MGEPVAEMLWVHGREHGERVTLTRDPRAPWRGGGGACSDRPTVARRKPKSATDVGLQVQTMQKMTTGCRVILNKRGGSKHDFHEARLCIARMHVAPFHTRGPVHGVCSDELRAPRAAPFMSHCPSPTTARSMGGRSTTFTCSTSTPSTSSKRENGIIIQCVSCKYHTHATYKLCVRYHVPLRRG